MSRIAILDVVDLSAGEPDFPTPEQGLDDGLNGSWHAHHDDLHRDSRRVALLSWRLESAISSLDSGEHASAQALGFTTWQVCESVRRFRRTRSVRMLVCA